MLLHLEFFEVCLASTEGNLNVKSYSSVREDKRAYKRLGCLSGDKVSHGTYMPDLYVCGFARVAYVLRHSGVRERGGYKTRFIVNYNNNNSALLVIQSAL